MQKVSKDIDRIKVNSLRCDLLVKATVIAAIFVSGLISYTSHFWLITKVNPA